MPGHETWITLLLLCAFWSPASCQRSLCGDAMTTSLVFTPSSLILNRDMSARSVTIICRYPRVQGMEGRRVLLNRVSDVLAVSGGLAGADEEYGLRELSSIKGVSVHGIFNSSINFTLPAASCIDGRYTYMCETTSSVGTSANTVTCLQAGRLTITSEPSDVRIVADPDLEAFSVGDILTLTCSATVGLMEEKEASEWVWEEKEGGGPWTPMEKDIYLGKQETVKDCVKVRKTVFKVILKSSHHSRTYRCYLVKEDRAFTEAAGQFHITVDSFIFGLNTANGSVVLAGILIILAAVLVAMYVVVHHIMRRHINQERNMYRERVMNRLDKLFRFEADLIGGVMKKRKSQVTPPPTPSLPPPPPPPPPIPKEEVEEEEEETSVDPTEITIQLHMPVTKDLSDSNMSDISDTESVSTEAESDPAPPEEEYVDDPTGPILKAEGEWYGM